MTSTQETTAAAAAPPGVRGSGWGAVGAVAAATFTVVTSEMLPVGLLTPIGSALGVSEGTAGMTLTVTGLVAALAAPLLMPALGGRDRRVVLCGLMALLALGNLLAAWSPGFAAMLVARVLVGVGMGGVWAIAVGVAGKLVAERSVASATSLIFSGVAIASVLGVPAGSWVGELLGWRAAFAVAAGLALAVLAALALLLPPLDPEREVRLGSLLGLARVPQVGCGLAIVALLVTGHFAAYTYVRPVLEEVAGVPAGEIGILLLLYGVAGVAGNFLAGAVAARAPRMVLLAISGALAATVAATAVAGTTTLAAALLLAAWGVAYGGVSVSTQTWLLRSAPHDREAVSAIFTGVFNGAIALGALTGGLAADGLGVRAGMWLAAALALLSGAVAAVGRAPGRPVAAR